MRRDRNSLSEPARNSGVLERETETAVSLVPISREASTSTRQTQLGDIPARWLDQLVVAMCELPVAQGEEGVARALVRALAEILPDCGAGACLASPAHGPRVEQRIFKYTPPGEEHRGVGVDPVRLFPGYEHERVLESEPGGSTLHLASDDPALGTSSSPLSHLLERASLAMGHGLAVARAHDRATGTAAELRLLSSHMVQAEKLASLGQIAAGIVHELNNPLTSIVAYTDYLLRSGKNDADDTERLRRIAESAGRMLRFTRDLVTYARPSSEVLVPVSLHTVIDQALAFCEHVIADAGAKVERRFGDDLPAVRGMPEQLAQVFVNLFTNACHAMPEGQGKLVVSTRTAEGGSFVVVAVEDNGHGIAPEHLPQIFTPFFTTKGAGRGTGLGLSIVKNIIDKHSGEIRAERPATSGTLFVMKLPAIVSGCDGPEASPAPRER